MATATLELVNPYSKLGLKRRPTYDEVINLIKENETITGKLPDRTATFYKASPEGSFFDGSDALEILKEQQNRIMEREMRDILMRQTVRANGGTFHMERHRQSISETAPSAEVQPDRSMLPAQVQADLERRQQQLRDRQQQTGQATQSFLQRSTTMPIIGGMLSSLRRSGARSVGGTPSGVQHFDLPANDPPEPEVISSGTTSEAEMLTARTNPEDLIKNALQSKRPEADEGLINSVAEVLVKHSNYTPEQIVRDYASFNILNQIYRTLHRSGFISENVLDEYQELTSKLTQERGGRKRASLLRELADHYRKKCV